MLQQSSGPNTVTICLGPSLLQQKQGLRPASNRAHTFPNSHPRRSKSRLQGLVKAVLEKSVHSGDQDLLFTPVSFLPSGLPQ